MTLQININPGASVFGGSVLGVMTASGNPWSVPDEMAHELVNRGIADASNWPVFRPNLPDDYLQISAPSALGALRAVLVGHSYMDQETQTYSYNRPLEMLNGTVVWANVLLGRPWEIIKSHAIGGERLIDLAARIQFAVNENCDLYFWNIGINDLKNTVNAGNSRFLGTPYPDDPNQTRLDYCISMADRLLSQLEETGRFIFVLPEMWPANGAGDQTRHLAARTLQYNRFLAWRASKSARILYVPLDVVTMDPNSTAGNVRTGYYADFIHPSNIGAFERGKVLAKAIKPYIKKIDRLPWNAIDTWSNLKIAGTALAANGDGTLRVTLNNISGANTLIRKGDSVALAVPSAGQTQWNGRYQVVAHTNTYIDVSCKIPGSFVGAVNVSTATNMFDNPLFLTQTGGSVSGGLVLTSGTVPSGVVISGTATCSVVVNNTVAHTDLDGVADGLGNWMDITITGAANNQVDIFLLANRGPAVTASAVYGRIFAGDTVSALFDVEVVSINGVTTLMSGLNGSVTHRTDGAQTLLVLGTYRDGTNNAAHPNSTFRGVLGCAEYLIPPGTLEAFDGYLAVKFDVAGGSIRLRVGRVGVVVIDNNRTLRDVSVRMDI